MRSDAVRGFWQRHRIALIAALIVGGITVAPSLLAPLTLHGGYRGVLFSPLDDENLYRGIIHDVLDGHPFPNSPFLYDYKSTAPILFAPYSYWLYALPALVIGLSNAILLAKFLFPAILFFLVYLLVRSLVEDDPDGTLLAATAGLAVVLGYEFVNYHYLLLAVRGITPMVPPVWTRLVNPIVGALEVFAFLILLQRIWQGERLWLTRLGASVVLALSVSYYFSFGISLAVLGSLAVIGFIKKEWGLVRDLVVVGIIAIMLDAWYFWSAISSVNGDPLMQTRNGMSFSHAPVVNALVLVATIVVALLFYYSYIWRERRESLRTWLFIIALLAASWIAFNEQVLTGRDIWHFHFVQYTIPFSMISILIAYHLALRIHAPRLWRFTLITMCIAALACGIFSISSYRSHTANFALEQTSAPLLTWLVNNAPNDCVVFMNESPFGTDYKPGSLIPAYTQCNVYLPLSTDSLPQDRLLHNYFLYLRFQGIEPQGLRAYLMTHPREVHLTFFENWPQQTTATEDQWFLEKVGQLVNLYPAFYSGDLKKELTAHRVDYIASQDPLTPPLLARLSGLKKIAVAGDYTIYSF